MEQLLLAISVFICFATSVYGTLTDISVQTNVGTINGLTDDAVQFQGSIKTVSRFLGIPFAKPPVGERRFRRPEVLKTLQSPYNATYHRPLCLQSTAGGFEYIKYFKTGEDCLYLNIYVPGSDLTAKNKYPVMIWIHGGNFKNGDTDIYSGDILSAFHNVIVINFSYRLGPFGFLTDGSRYSGNFGLWDQKMVIQWVHDHIDSFGGDISKVTLFGESAGAFSVLYQALHVGNKGKIRRIIAQSGSSLTPLALDSEMTAKNNFKTFADSNSCTKPTFDLTVKCLQGKRALDILPISENSVNFRPIVDMDFVKESPVVLFANKTDAAKEAMQNFGLLDFLTGVNSKEGATIMASNVAHIFKAAGIDLNNGVPKAFFDSFFRSTLPTVESDYNSTAFFKAFSYAYTDWYHPADKLIVREKMLETISDLYFVVPAIETARSHAYMSSGKTYFYVFDHKPSFVPNPVWLKGATHFVEVPFIFGLPNIMKKVYPITDVPMETNLSAVLMERWTNFAKTGNPNAEELQQPTWPVYTSDMQQYLTLSSNMTSQSVQQRFAATRVAFWTDLVPALQNCSEKMTSQHGSIETSGADIANLNLALVFILSFCF